MSEMKKNRLWCPYCESRFVMTEVPEKYEFDCPECGISLSHSEVHYIGHEIDCKGAMFDRTESKHHYDTDIPSIQAQREKAFYEAWEAEHERSDLLQMLLAGVLRDDPIISDRERLIVNTVIQWLGTNVGFNFVEIALNNAGYEIRKKQEKE